MAKASAVGRWPAFGAEGFGAYWIGGLVSDIGNWVQATTVPYVVLVLTHQAVWVGVATAVGQLAQAAMILPGGRLADRGGRMRVLVIGNCAQLVLALGLAATYASGRVRPWEIIAIVGVMSLGFGLQHPSWQTLPSELVGPALLSSASHLTVTKFQAARALGPLLAGALIAGPGAVYAFWFNAASFVAALLALLWISRVRPTASAARDRKPVQRQSGSGKAFAMPAVVVGVMLTTAVAVLGLPTVQLATLLASDTYHVGADAYGILVSAFGWGSLVVAVVISSFHGRRSRRGLAVGGLFLLAIAELAVGGIPHYAVGVAAMGLAGASFALVTTGTHAAIQILAPPQSRGHAVGAYLLALRGGGGIGALVLVWLAGFVGVRTVLTLSGSIALVLVAGLIMRPRWAGALDATSQPD